MTDSRAKSISEAILNILPAFWISWVGNVAFVPLFADDYSSGDAARIGMASIYVGILFTVISLVRQYYFRRWFARMLPNENIVTLSNKLYQHIVTFLKQKRG